MTIVEGLTGMPDFDLLVLGGGPGGYVAAIRAAQHGLSVGLVEKERPGGVCLNWGCIPTKAMLRSAEAFDVVRRAHEFGVRTGEPTVDYDAVRRRKDDIVKGLADGVAGLLRANSVTTIAGHARMTGPTSVEILEVGDAPLGPGGPLYAAPPTGTTATRSVSARDVVIATGSRPAELPVPGADLPGVITSDGAFGLTEVPERVVIVGGSAVGAEWATLFAEFGAAVTVVEMQPTLVPAEDAAIGAALARSFRSRGIGVLTSSTVSAIEVATPLRVVVDGPEPGLIEADVVLVGAGRVPNTRDLGLDVAGVTTDRRGFVTVDDRMRTDVKHVFAIGDVTGRAMLAHVASHQGLVAADVVAGHDRRMDYRVVPAATFTHPEIASVGLNEAAARKAGMDVTVATFPFAGLGRSRTFGRTEGFMKIVAGTAHGEILGVHVIGPSASDLITEGALALTLEATLDDLAETVHAHPTLGEIGMEAALVALGLPVHANPPRTR
nr:dihydrolipoyl dehydrogenase [Parafrankia sp. EUN1f]